MAIWRPGELDQLVDIERNTLTDDGMGGDTSSWATIANGASQWCAVRPISGSEVERYDRVVAPAMAKFIFRYREDIRVSDRIVWQGVAYNIKYIAPTPARHLYIEIDAERGVPQ